MPQPTPKPRTRGAYLTRAAERFLSGLDFWSPAAAVEAGAVG